MPRLPEVLDREALSEEQREVYDYIVKTRGRVGLPYSVFLNHPELCNLKLAVGTYVRFNTSLPHDILELAICTAAREMDCRFEWAAHAAAAQRAGVSPEVVDIIAYKKQLDGLPEEQALPIRFARQTLRQHRVDDATYGAALERYGTRGVIELTAAIGYYIMSACWMNVLEIEPPADRPQLPRLA